MICRLLGNEAVGAVVVLVSRGAAPSSPGRLLARVRENPIPGAAG